MGEAEFERDGSLVTVVLDGQPQSAVDLDDPQRLDFEYVQHLALCIETLAPHGLLRVTHVGGASGSPHQVMLTGTGTATAGPG